MLLNLIYASALTVLSFGCLSAWEEIPARQPHILPTRHAKMLCVDIDGHVVRAGLFPCHPMTLRELYAVETYTFEMPEVLTDLFTPETSPLGDLLTNNAGISVSFKGPFIFPSFLPCGLHDGKGEIDLQKQISPLFSGKQIAFSADSTAWTLGALEYLQLEPSLALPSQQASYGVDLNIHQTEWQKTNETLFPCLTIIVRNGGLGAAYMNNASDVYPLDLWAMPKSMSFPLLKSLIAEKQLKTDVLPLDLIPTLSLEKKYWDKAGGPVDPALYNELFQAFLKDIQDNVASLFPNDPSLSYIVIGGEEYVEHLDSLAGLNASVVLLKPSYFHSVGMKTDLLFQFGCHENFLKFNHLTFTNHPEEEEFHQFQKDLEKKKKNCHQ